MRYQTVSLTGALRTRTANGIHAEHRVPFAAAPAPRDSSSPASFATVGVWKKLTPELHTPLYRKIGACPPPPEYEYILRTAVHSRCRMAPKTKEKQPSRSKPESAAPLQVNWPPLRPLVPSLDLYIDPILPNQIFLIRNFFTSSLCKNYVSFLSSLPLTTTPSRPKSKDEAVRVNDRFQIQDAEFAERLWSQTALRDLVSECRGLNDGEEDDLSGLQRQTWGGMPLGLNPNIRIYRYSPGQFFAQHCMFLFFMLVRGE